MRDECLKAVRGAQPQQATEAVTAHFRDAFEARRGRGMRPDVDAAAWNNLYRAAVNTSGRAVAPVSALVALGDRLQIAAL